MVDQVDVVAVVGACLSERRRYARHLAELVDVPLLTSTDLLQRRDPLATATREAEVGPVVIEFPDGTPLQQVIGVLADPDGRTRLIEIVCVVDAAHLVADLQGMETVAEPVGDGPVEVRFTTRARAVCAQLEFASTVVVVNWEACEDIGAGVALIGHLAPRARIELDAGIVVPLDPDRPYGLDQDRPGWVALLNDDLAPAHTHPRVQAFRYEQHRPLHPGRLLTTLDAMSGNRFGLVLRSSGFARLATRRGLVAQWDHVGTVISLDPVGKDRPGEEPLSIGQDLGIIGLDLDVPALVEALDAAALTDDEFLAGPTLWAGLPDPLPAWPHPSHRRR